MNLPGFLINHPDGEIRLRGHRIGLFHLISHYNQGEPVNVLHDRFPTLPPELIREAIAFYHENQPEVDAYLAGYQAELDRQRAAAPEAGPSLAELRRRMEAVKRASLK